MPGIKHILCLIRGKCRSSECPKRSYWAPTDQVWLLQHHHPGGALHWGHGLLHHVPGSFGLTSLRKYGEESSSESNVSRMCVHYFVGGIYPEMLLVDLGGIFYIGILCCTEHAEILPSSHSFCFTDVLLKTCMLNQLPISCACAHTRTQWQFSGVLKRNMHCLFPKAIKMPTLHSTYHVKRTIRRRLISDT